MDRLSIQLQRRVEVLLFRLLFGKAKVEHGVSLNVWDLRHLALEVWSGLVQRGVLGAL
jgi:hypothetical protein